MSVYEALVSNHKVFIFTMLKASTVSSKRQSDLYTFFILGIHQKHKMCLTKDKKFK